MGAVHFLVRAGMAGASSGPSIHRGPTRDDQGPSERHIVVAPLAGAMTPHAKILNLTHH